MTDDGREAGQRPAQDAELVVCLQPEPRVHLHAADGRQVVALAVEEQRLEHGFGGLGDQHDHRGRAFLDAVRDFERGEAIR